MNASESHRAVFFTNFITPQNWIDEISPGGSRRNLVRTGSGHAPDFSTGLTLARGSLPQIEGRAQCARACKQYRLRAMANALMR